MMRLQKGLSFPFSYMIMFKGVMSFNPNTLNNNIGAYFMAYRWQEAGKPYDQWIQIMKDYAQESSKFGWSFDMTLFNTISIYGDGTVFPQLEAVSYFDPSRSQPLVSLKKPFPMSSQMGKHKAIIADQDTDSQAMSKLYAFQMVLDESLSYKGLPTSFRSMSSFVLSKVKGVVGGTGRVGGSKADWISTGKIHKFGKKSLDSNQVINNFYKDYLQKENANFKMMQYRYNFQTKMSQVVGAIEASKNDIATTNANWRIAVGTNKRLYGSKAFRFKPVKYFEQKDGILFDLSDSLYQFDDSQRDVVYPKKIKLEIKKDNKVIKTIDQCPQKLMKQNGGFCFLEDFKLEGILQSTLTLSDPQLQIDLAMQFNEQQFELQVRHRYIKTQMNGTFEDFMSGKYENILSEKNGLETKCKTYDNYVTVQCFCSQLSQKYSGRMLVSLQSAFAIMNFRNLKGKLEQKLGRQLPNFIQKVFKSQDNYDLMMGATRQLQQNYVDKKYIPKNCQITDPFKLVFVEPDHFSAPTIKTLHFVNGIAKCDVKLNIDLTNENNPRGPMIQSLCIIGALKPLEIQEKSKGKNYYQDQKEEIIITKKEKKMISISEGHFNQNNDFSAVFYENKVQKTDSKLLSKVDWKHVVGPKLRMMALMYPAMQGIVDLYNFKAFSMDAMKRAFEVEDINHSRYMPATREISPTEHRQIRRWLYEPYYDYNFCIKHQEYIKRTLNNQKQQSFEVRKKMLINDIKNAWSVELMTIPLYLSAMFTAPNKSTKKLLKSIAIEEMKHLFIVSNALNALGDSPPYNQPHYIPNFPGRFSEIMQVDKDSKIYDFLNFDIQACTREQILKFIIVELPTESWKIKLLPDGIKNPVKRARIEEAQRKIDQVNVEKTKKFIGIGDVYAEIMDDLWALNDIDTKEYNSTKLFTGDPNMQFTYFYLKDMCGIFDFRTILNQFRQIVEEGEGSNLFKPTGEENRQSHFLKFLEIFVECQVKSIKYRQIDQPKVQSKEKYFVIEFEDDDKLQTQNNLVWFQQIDYKVDKSIQEDVSHQRYQGGAYVNDYAKESFLNMYKKIMDEFNAIFNLTPAAYNIQMEDQCKKQSSNLKQGKNSNHFQKYRTKRMENAIAEMRQMTLVSKSFITPNQISFKNYPNDVKYDSTRPPFNINQDRKQKK